MGSAEVVMVEEAKAVVGAEAEGSVVEATVVAGCVQSSCVCHHSYCTHFTMVCESAPGSFINHYMR